MVTLSAVQTRKVKCIICEKDTTNKTKTCSKSCASKLAYANQLTHHVCCICDKKTKTSKSVINAGLPVYCKQCSITRYKLYCKTCNKQFYGKKNNVKCCSKESVKEYNKNNKIQLVCDYCKSKYKQSRYNVYSGKNHYCSIRCNNNAYSKRNPTRYGSGWSTWIKRIRERDKHCLKCGETNNLEVHHFIKLKQFDDPNDAHFENNLGLFCITCHKEIENKYNSLSDFLKDIVRPQ